MSGISHKQSRTVIHSFSEDFVFEEPSEFTDPFRYVPHPAVKEAARLVMEQIESDPELASDFSEGKMLGVLVCREGYLAAFSGNVGGRSVIDGFVPPIYDLTDPTGEFKRREAEITALNHRIDELISSQESVALQHRLAESEQERDKQLGLMREAMNEAKRKRSELRAGGTDEETLARLVRESQFEKAEFRRLKTSWEERIAAIQSEMESILSEVELLKRKRACMSESLQDWIFRQYIVHNARGEASSIADIFASAGLVPPGGTGECAAPKLLEYAYRNTLEPLAMGEFWYGKASETAVRVHGHFYPSCTSKCGPLLGYMLRGMSISEWPMIPKTPAFASLRLPLAGGGMSSPSSGHSDVEQTVQPIQIPEPITLYEDEAMIVVEKPSGMPSVPGLDGRKSLLEWLSSAMPHEHPSVTSSEHSPSVMSSERSESRHLHPVHRLDMDTSGVMVFAKTHEAAVNLRRQFEEHTIRKTYMARISAPLSSPSGSKGDETVLPPWPQGEGLFRHPWSQMGCAGTIELPLSPDYDERPRQKVDFKQGKAAHTDYEIVEVNPDGTADLLLYPHTGRTHQLRVHCAHALGLGHPILGDLLYGGHCIRTSPVPACVSASSATNHPTRLCLHALSITFIHPQTNAPLTFTSRELCY